MLGVRQIVSREVALWITVSAHQQQAAFVVNLAQWWEVDLECAKQMEQLVLKIFNLQIVVVYAWQMFKNAQMVALSPVTQQMAALSQPALHLFVRQMLSSVQMVAMSPVIQRTIAISQPAPQLFVRQTFNSVQMAAMSPVIQRMAALSQPAPQQR